MCAREERDGRVEFDGGYMHAVRGEGGRGGSDAETAAEGWVVMGQLKLVCLRCFEGSFAVITSQSENITK